MDSDLTLSSVVPTNAGTTWVWKHELDSLSSRLVRIHEEEACNTRRGAEEAERCVLRRVEEAERRMLRSQSQESEVLQRFLSGWNCALEARLERQSGQISALERRTSEEAERSERFRADTNNCAEDARRTTTEVFKGIQERVNGIEQTTAELVAKLTEQVSAEDVLGRVSERFEQKLADGLAFQENSASAFGATIVERLVALEEREDLGLEVAQVNAQLAFLKKTVTDIQRDLRSEFADECSRLSEEFAQRTDQCFCEVAKRAEDVQALHALHEHLASETREELSYAADAARTHTLGLEHETKGHIASLEEQLCQCIVKCESIVASERLEERLQASEAQLEMQFRDDFRRWDEQALELSHRADANRAELRAVAVEHSEYLATVSADCRRLVAEWEMFRLPGLSHEWCIPRCMQQMRHLQVSSKAGMWIDSESFYLGAMGPLTLCLYPRGLKHNHTGQVAVALRLGVDARALVSMAMAPCVDLAVGGLRRRAAFNRTGANNNRGDPDVPSGSEFDIGTGGLAEAPPAMWLAERLGDFDEHTGGSDADELIISVTIPSFSVPASFNNVVANTSGKLSATPIESEVGTVVHEPICARGLDFGGDVWKDGDGNGLPPSYAPSSMESSHNEFTSCGSPQASSYLQEDRASPCGALPFSAVTLRNLSSSLTAVVGDAKFDCKDIAFKSEASTNSTSNVIARLRSTWASRSPNEGCNSPTLGVQESLGSNHIGKVDAVGTGDGMGYSSSRVSTNASSTSQGGINIQLAGNDPVGTSGSINSMTSSSTLVSTCAARNPVARSQALTTTTPLPHTVAIANPFGKLAQGASNGFGHGTDAVVPQRGASARPRIALVGAPGEANPV